MTEPADAEAQRAERAEGAEGADARRAEGADDAQRAVGADDAQRAEAQRKIRNRLRRARGQLDAVIAAVEDGAPCRDVVTQLAAVSSALDRAGYAIVASAMTKCVADPDGAADPDGLTQDELEKLFLMLA